MHGAYAMRSAPACCARQAARDGGEEERTISLFKPPAGELEVVALFEPRDSKVVFFREQLHLPASQAFQVMLQRARVCLGSQLQHKGVWLKVP